MKPTLPNFNADDNLHNLIYKLVSNLSLTGLGAELARRRGVADAPWKDNEARISDWKNGHRKIPKWMQHVVIDWAEELLKTERRKKNADMQKLELLTLVIGRARQEANAVPRPRMYQLAA
jgi:hypothetical protein